MKTTSRDIRSLVNSIDSGEIRLPEIQRAYVWKASQIAGLIDSLYRGYPSGSLLLWETDSEVEERNAAIEGPNQAPLTKPQYLLDGQQRLTSLHRVVKGHQNARVVFNVESERFQLESAATKKDSRWTPVGPLLSETEGLFGLVGALAKKLPNLPPDTIIARLERVRKIGAYLYYIEVVEQLPYDEVTEIFVRVNSRGRPLRAVDLALATISARWPGVVDKLEAEAERWTAEGYRHINVGFLARALAALATDTATLRGFASTPVIRLEDGWDRVRQGLEHLVPLLKHNADIATSALLPSMNALVPLVAYLGLLDGQQLPADDASALIYWLFGAFLLARYSGPVDTVIAQDVAAVRSSDPLTSLYRNLGILNERLAVPQESLVGRGANSPYFLFSYLAARRQKAKDWWFGVEIGSDLQGKLALEYHHIHPRATLQKSYSKAEINDLSNLAFISRKANGKIRDRSPAKYFPELGDNDLERHFVPLEEGLRVSAAYPAFLRARRGLLAEAITDLLDEFRPTRLTSETETTRDPKLGEKLSLTAFADLFDGSDGVLVLDAVGRDGQARVIVECLAIRRFLDDLEAGLASDLRVGEQVVSASPTDETIDIPVGPLLATGTLAEWQKVLDREVDDAQPFADAPAVPSQAVWTGPRAPFPISESD